MSCSEKMPQVTVASNWQWWHLLNPLVWPSVQSLLDLTALACMQDNLIRSSNFHVNDRVKACATQ